MNKFKINPNLMSILVLGSLFMGWQYLIFVILFIVLCENNENVKNILIKTVALLAACLILSTAWSIVTEGIDLLDSALDSLFSMSYILEMDISKPEFLTTLFGIVGIVTSFISSAISYIILFAKFTFIMSVINNKPFKKPFSKLDDYLNQVLNYIIGSTDQIVQTVTSNQTINPVQSNNVSQYNNTNINN